MTKTKALFNWSGGKDSSICLHKTLQSGEYDIPFLFTTVNAKYERITQHGVRTELLRTQAENIGLPVKIMTLPDTPTMENYNQMMKETLTGFKKENIKASIFGDIFLEDLRRYREERLQEIGFKGVFPLWKQDTQKLAEEFIEEGFKAIVVCIDGSRLDKSFAGREYDKTFLEDLPDEVDPCGEHGEFHTFVYDGPIFKRPVPFTSGDIVYRQYTPPAKKEDDDNDYTCGTNRTPHPVSGFWFCDLLPGE
ncbi:MAG: diphthine--ammonia ligase [Balneolales bacterium]